MNPPFFVFIVHDNSMLPTYKPGDHVVTFNWGNIHDHDVIVFSGLNPVTYFIKRVNRIANNKFYVAGDNKKDTAKFAPISKSQVIGKVICKY